MSYIKIFNEDCIKFMESQSDKSFDHTITDIPYDVVNRESGGIRVFDKNQADILTFNLKEFVRLITLKTKGYILIFCASEQVSELVKNLESYNYKTGLTIWQKNNPSPVNGQYMWLSGVECAVIAHPQELKKEIENKIWKHPSGRSKNHPTEKPEKLLKDIILTLTNENDTIFDPCAGSGSTLFTAYNLNRNSIGCEMFIDYYKKIKEKCSTIAK